MIFYLELRLDFLGGDILIKNGVFFFSCGLGGGVVDGGGGGDTDSDVSSIVRIELCCES
jgi:hypothetical protein